MKEYLPGSLDPPKTSPLSLPSYTDSILPLTSIWNSKTLFYIYNYKPHSQVTPQDRLFSAPSISTLNSWSFSRFSVEVRWGFGGFPWIRRVSVPILAGLLRFRRVFLITFDVSSYIYDKRCLRE